jgi:hypothetical protein
MNQETKTYPAPAHRKPERKIAAVQALSQRLAGGELHLPGFSVARPDLAAKQQAKSVVIAGPGGDRRVRLAPAAGLDPWQQAVLRTLSAQLRADASVDPDIDVVTGQVTQGLEVTLGGTGFGDATGRVFVQMLGQKTTTEIFVRSWTDTQIVAFMDGNAGGWRPQQGAIYVARAEGNTSTTYPVWVEPARDYYTAFFSHGFGGGLFGWVNYYVLFSNQRTPDPDMRIEEVDVFKTWGSADLEYPMAGGTELAQGLRLGLNAAAGMVATMRYLATIPRGIAPPVVTDDNDVPDWGHSQLAWDPGNIGWLG